MVCRAVYLPALLNIGGRHLLFFFLMYTSKHRITKSIAMAIAWYIQTIISAVSSALSGGLIMSRGLMKICRKKGFNMFGLIPDSDEETVIDEIMSYLLAAAGFYFQFKIGFTVPFPLNLILFPFQFVEYYIRWAITGVTG
jgi:hypothetical protein